MLTAHPDWTMPTGTVKKFRPDKRYGFITDDERRDDVFVYIDDVVSEHELFVEGARVRFERMAAPKGPKAVRVEITAAPSNRTRHQTGNVKTNLGDLLRTAVASLTPAKPNGVPESRTLTMLSATSPAPAPPRPAATPTRAQSTSREPKKAATPVVEKLPDLRSNEAHVAGASLAALLGIAKPPPGVSYFSVGNAVARSSYFRSASQELIDIVAGRLDRNGTPALEVTTRTMLFQHGIRSSADVANALRHATAVLTPVMRLALPRSSPAEIRAAIEMLRWAVTSTPTVAAELKAEIATNEPPKSENEPDETAVERTVSASVNADPDRSAGFSRALSEYCRKQLLPHTSALRQRCDELLNAVSKIEAAPLDEAIQLAFANTAGAFSTAIGTGISSIVKVGTAIPPSDGIDRAAALDAVTAAIGDTQSGFTETLLGVVLEKTAAEVMRAAQLCIDVQAASVPSWALKGWFGSDADRVSRLLSILRTPTLELELTQFVEWSKTLPESSQAVLQKIGYIPGAQVLETLQRGLDDFVESDRRQSSRNARLTVVQNALGDAIVSRIRAVQGRPGEALLGEAEQIAARLERCEHALHSAVVAELKEQLKGWPEDRTAEENLARIEDVIERLGAATTEFVPKLDRLLETANRLATVGAERAPRGTTQLRATAELSVSHPLSTIDPISGKSMAVRSADLVWVSAAPLEFGLVRFPVRLRVAELQQRDLDCRVEVHGDILDGLPAEWKQYYTTTYPVRIRAGRQHCDLVVTLPMPKGRAERVRLERKTIRLEFDLVHGTKISQAGLEWQGLSAELPSYSPPFSQSVTKKEMEQRPLGVEKDFARLRDHILRGRSSFRVHGPRRFGKTTLIRALCEHFNEVRQVAVTDIVSASENATAADLWMALGRQLSKRFDRPVEMRLDANGLPAEGVFDAVRTEAKARGVNAIYVIIDEAQAMFVAAPEAHALGEALKVHLENEWGMMTEKKCALLLGLVGQAHLPHLMGTNLLGAISESVTATTISSNELVPLLRPGKAAGLASSAEAREVLAREASNLWILERVLSQIAADCRQQGRAWFIESDVEEAIQRLVVADQSYRDITLWSYVRDVLNESDDKNDWRPSVTYPVALAWAWVKNVDATLNKAVDKVKAIVEVLDSWSDGFRISSQRVEEAFSRLRTQRVLSPQDTFELPMLERLLLGRAGLSEPFVEEPDRRALMRLGLQSIVAPEPLAVKSVGVHNGGQATVEQAKWQGKHVAVRRVRLTDSNADRRFVREVQLLEKLRDASDSLVPTARLFLPRLFAAGYDHASPETGLIIYEWVEGVTLERDQLSANGALLVLGGLGKALKLCSLLHVIHRDIRPDNVLIRAESGSPVLIDFGLSIEFGESLRSTSLTGIPEFLPPEVTQNGPDRWSFAGDIFSLGKTLQACCTEAALQDGPIRNLLARMTDGDPTKRPGAAEVCEMADEWLEQRKFRQRDDQDLRLFNDAMAKLPDNARSLGPSAASDFLAARRGLVGTKVRLVQASEFLENLVQAKVRAEFPHLVTRLEANGRSTFLTALPEIQSLPQALKPLACDASVYVGKLRNLSAHPVGRDLKLSELVRGITKQARPIQGTSQGGTRPLERAVRETAVRIADWVKVPDLKAVVHAWLPEE